MMPAFLSKYKIIEKIGEGSFSEVLKCEDRASRELYAAKILKKSFKNPSDVLYCAEIIAMQKLSQHPNVLYMLEYFFEKCSGKVIFVFELMDMSLYEYMKAKKRCIPEIRVKNYLYQMLNGLDYLHRHGLFHRDIKPENILIKVLPPNKTTLLHNNELVKLADLGSIRGIYSKPPYTEYISTRWYRSPECLLTVGHYGPKMDIWATGCVFYEILTMKPLFPGTNEIDQLARIHHVLGTPSARLLGKLKSRSKNLQNFVKQIGTGLTVLVSQFSEDGQTVLKLMLQYDPDIRSNAQRLLKHRYFAAFREEERYLRQNKLQMTREYGDVSTFNYNSGSEHQFQSSSLKNIAPPPAQEKSRGSSKLNSKTTIELQNRRIMRGQGSKNSLKLNASVELPRKTRPPNSQKVKSKGSNAKNNMFRNTTSNLTKKVSCFEVHKGKQFHSSSYVSSKRVSTKEKRNSDSKRPKL